MAVPLAQPAILGPSDDDLAQAIQEFMHDSGGGAFAAPPLPMQQQVVLAQPGLEEMLEEHMENVNVTDLLSAEGDPMSSPNGVVSSSGDVEPVRPSVAPDPTVIPSGLFESPQVVRPSAAPPVPSLAQPGVHARSPTSILRMPVRIASVSASTRPWTFRRSIRWLCLRPLRLFLSERAHAVWS